MKSGETGKRGLAAPAWAPEKQKQRARRDVLRGAWLEQKSTSLSGVFWRRLPRRSRGRAGATKFWVYDSTSQLIERPNVALALPDRARTVGLELYHGLEMRAGHMAVLVYQKYVECVEANGRVSAKYEYREHSLPSQIELVLEEEGQTARTMAMVLGGAVFEASHVADFMGMLMPLHLAAALKTLRRWHDPADWRRLLAFPPYTDEWLR